MKKNLVIVTIILSMLLLTLIPLSVNAATSGTFGNNLKWALDSNGTLTITGTGAMPDWNTGRETPWSDYGSNNSKITKVIIGDGITTIGNCAFEELRKLQSITLNDDIQSIGNYAFNNCYGLKMTRVCLPYSLTSIGKYAFFGCNISIIDIPYTVTYIGVNAFSYSECLEELRADGNSYYSSLNGNLYNGDKTKLIQYIEDDTTFTVPDSVTTIGEWAFYNYNGNLSTITIPETVTKIESSAFYKCSKLEEVIYDGTKAQWDKINIGSSNTPLTNANIQFLQEDEIITIFDVTISTVLSKDFKQNIVVECNIEESFDGTIYGKIYDKDNSLLGTVPFEKLDDYFEASFSVDNVTADYIIKLQILDENNIPISNEYEKEYSISHKPIIKGYITNKRVYDDLDSYIKIEVLTDEREVSYKVNEQRVYINGIAYKSTNSSSLEETYNAIQVDTTNEVFIWLNDDNTVRVISNERPDVKTIIEKSDGTFNVNLFNATQNDKILFACYYDEQLTYLKIRTYTDISTLPFTPDKEYDEVKVMVWENLKTLVPLCKAEDVPLN